MPSYSYLPSGHRRRIAKHFFEPHIREMLIVSSQDDYLEVLSKDVDLEVLPPSIAPGVGRGRGMPGYFDNVLWQGGPVPSRKELETIIQERQRESLLREKGRGALPKLERVDSDSTCISSLRSLSDGSTMSITGGSMLKGYWKDAPETQDGKFFVVFPSKMKERFSRFTSQQLSHFSS